MVFPVTTGTNSHEIPFLVDHRIRVLVMHAKPLVRLAYNAFHSVPRHYLLPHSVKLHRIRFKRISVPPVRIRYSPHRLRMMVVLARHRAKLRQVTQRTERRFAKQAMNVFQFARVLFAIRTNVPLLFHSRHLASPAYPHFPSCGHAFLRAVEYPRSYFQGLPHLVSVLLEFLFAMLAIYRNHRE